ncbi:MAG: 4Fe-4S binding protein [Desulfuromonadaceae bacterium]|nr:4Fe-4S binding protein [Desulfuromonadaceae bacterium]
MPLPRITRKRQFVQGLLIAAALLLPFASVSGKPLLRMDIAKMTLFLAGIPLRIDQFYLVLLVILVCVASFLLLTAILGRVWCGWLCPQTVFNDVAELLVKRFRGKSSAGAARLIEHAVALVIASTIAFNLFCWFLPPRQVVMNLRAVTTHPAMVVTFVLLTLFGYLNLILVKRSFCRSYCPYGRFQTALMDAGTLNLSFLEEVRDRCLRCNACVRTCPMGIDIREGFQIECIGCGRCIDACRGVMERKPEGTGLIDYRFGTVKGTRFKFGNITVVLTLVTLLLTAGLVWAVLGRTQNAFAVQRVATADTRHLPDGSVAQPWRAIIGNRSESPQTYSLRIEGQASSGVELLGQVQDIIVAPNQHRDVTFMIHSAKNSVPQGKIVLQLVSGDRVAASVAVTP